MLTDYSVPTSLILIPFFNCVENGPELIPYNTLK